MVAPLIPLPPEEVANIVVVTGVTHPSPTYVAIGDSSYDVGGWGMVSIFVTVHSLTGTSPTLDVKVQHCPSITAGYDNWADLIAVPQFTATGTKCVIVPNNSGSPQWTFGRYLRVVGTVGGTDSPEFTASVKLSPKE